MDKKPTGAGKSSFELIDSNILFSELGLREDSVFLDVGCGNGAYSIAAASHIGERGKIYAVDLWKEGIDYLNKKVATGQTKTICTILADVSEHIPIEDHCIDVCLMATVFHDLVQDNTAENTLKEIKRVMKRGGSLAIIEFKKMDGPPGPPAEIRIPPEKLEKMLLQQGFLMTKTLDLGPYNYLAVFTHTSTHTPRDLAGNQNKEGG